MNFLKQGYMLPLLSSLLLLSLFLGKFLHSEYYKEIDSMVLEKRDSVFIEIFTELDGMPDHITLDSIQKMTKFHFFEQDKTISGLNYRSIEIQDTAKPVFTVFPEGIRDSVSFSISKHDVSDSFYLEDDGKGNVIWGNTPRLKNNKAFPIMTSLTKNNKVEIKPLTVWKRMIPQTLFSILLLGLTILSYYLIGKTLNKERRLAELRNDFVSNMSHELKTPVSTIGVALEALSSFDAANDKEKRQEYINISKLEVERLGLLVDKALNISLFEQGKFIYQKQPIDMDLEIQKVLATLKIPLENKQIDLLYEKTGNDFSANVDKSHIVNVVHNLVENAIKYSKENPSIKIRLFDKFENLEIHVIDNAGGIPKEYQDKVFDKFFRVPQGNTHNTKGHGLGLSYVKEVIEKHGGTIQLQSTIGKGSTFIIQIPKSIA